MAKYISYNKNLRCKVSIYKLFNCLQLQLQERYLFFFFVNVGHFYHIHLESYENEIDSWVRPNPRTDSYIFGDISERWAKGTFDLEKRVRQLFCEHAQAKKRIEKVRSILENIIS